MAFAISESDHKAIVSLMYHINRFEALSPISTHSKDAMSDESLRDKRFAESLINRKMNIMRAQSRAGCEEKLKDKIQSIFSDFDLEYVFEGLGGKKYRDTLAYLQLEPCPKGRINGADYYTSIFSSHRVEDNLLYYLAFLKSRNEILANHFREFLANKIFCSFTSGMDDSEEYMQHVLRSYRYRQMVLGLIDFDQIIKIAKDNIEEQLITPKQATVLASRCKTPPPREDSKAPSPGRASVDPVKIAASTPPLILGSRVLDGLSAEAPQPRSAPTVP